MAVDRACRPTTARPVQDGARGGSTVNVGDKLLTLVMSARAGGDCIDDSDALRSSDTGRVLGHTVKAPSTLGTFLRSSAWGHVRAIAVGDAKPQSTDGLSTAVWIKEGSGPRVLTRFGGNLLFMLDGGGLKKHVP